MEGLRSQIKSLQLTEEAEISDRLALSRIANFHRFPVFGQAKVARSITLLRMSSSRQEDESVGVKVVLHKSTVEASYCLPFILEVEFEKAECTTATLSSASDLNDPPYSHGMMQSRDLPKAGDCDAENEGHAQADSRPVGQKQQSFTTSADHKWKQKYKRLLADYNDRGEDLEEVKDELSAAESLLSKEKTKRRQRDATHAELKEDFQGLLDDRGKLYEECAKMKRLLESRDQDIASLVAQANLHIQVGTMKLSDGDSTTDVSSEQSRNDSNRASSSDTGSVISSLGSFFVTPRQPSLGSFFSASRRSSMEWKKQANDTNQDSCRTSLTSVGQSGFDTKGPTPAVQRSWSGP